MKSLDSWLEQELVKRPGQQVVQKTTAIGTPKLPNIKGVVLLKGPIDGNAVYDLYVGYIQNDKDSDIPHYLVVNRDFEVVEASAAALAIAKEAMAGLMKRLTPEQEADLVEFRAN